MSNYITFFNLGYCFRYLIFRNVNKAIHALRNAACLLLNLI